MLDRVLKEAQFDGDIIITDPCYVMKRDNNDWSRSNYGEFMDVLGVHGITNETLYGDWSCTVYNTDTEEEIGHFTADAGMVSVLSLDDVLRYNPDFDYHINRKWTTTLIPDFQGTVQIVEKWFTLDDTSDSFIEVIGNGKNNKTGEPINFFGYQTGY